MAKIYLLTGGVRSGKSEYAENLAGSNSCKVCYLATASVTDGEMEKRISIHKNRRPDSWITLELSDNDIKAGNAGEIFSRIKNLDVDFVIIDCITNLLFRLIYKFNDGGILDNSELIDNMLEEKIENECMDFFEDFTCKLKQARDVSGISTAIVSNEVGLGIVPFYPFGRIFRDMLGMANKKIAALADEVLFFVSGLNIKIK
jgi:adenosylcobinamide kinase / adenosylcobinamide-phosphate guanylyltransferase